LDPSDRIIETGGRKQKIDHVIITAVLVGIDYRSCILSFQGVKLFFEAVDLPVIGKNTIVDQLNLIIDISDDGIPLLDLILNHGQLSQVRFFIFLNQVLIPLKLGDLLLDLPPLFLKVVPRLPKYGSREREGQQVQQDFSHGPKIVMD
jgi:hypothetical protein